MDAEQALREFGDFVSSLGEDSRGLMYCDVCALQESFSVLSNTIDALREQTQWRPMETCPLGTRVILIQHNHGDVKDGIVHAGWVDLDDDCHWGAGDFYGWMQRPEVE